MPLGNVLDTELKHKQNYFARRIKHNSQTDEKREMLTIYNEYGAEKKTVWRHTALLPSGNLNFRLFDSSGDVVSITLKNLLAIFVAHMWHAICMLLHQSMYKHWNVFNQDQSIKTEILVLQSWFLCLCSVFIILAQSWNLPTCFLGRSGSCGREFGGIVYRC